MRFLTTRLTPALALLMVLPMCAQAREVQLAGIRLGDHAINILDVYGTPDGIAVGEGPALPAQTPGDAAQAVQMSGPTDEALRMGPGWPVPAGTPGMPGMGGPDAGAMPGQMGGPGGFPAGPPADAGATGAGGMGASGGGSGGFQTQPFPIWALAVWVNLGPREVEWIYQKGNVVLGFVLDRDGFCKLIAVAAERCDYARTALWQPHRYVKLGDDFKRVIYRYGYPDDVLTFSASGPGDAALGGGTISVQFGPTVRTYSRDCILRYSASNNIEFTMHNMVITRIHIWE